MPGSLYESLTSVWLQQYQEECERARERQRITITTNPTDSGVGRTYEQYSQRTGTGTFGDNGLQTVVYDRALIENTRSEDIFMQFDCGRCTQQPEQRTDTMTRVEAIEAMMRGEKVRYNTQAKRSYCFFDKERGFYIYKNGDTYLMKDSWARTDWEIYEELSLKDEYKKVMKKFA